MLRACVAWRDPRDAAAVRGVQSGGAERLVGASRSRPIARGRGSPDNLLMDYAGGGGTTAAARLLAAHVDPTSPMTRPTGREREDPSMLAR